MMQRLADTRLTVFGVGGVGSWCVEALARSGIGNIRIVDSDVVAESNINRQMPALYSTLGKPKVEVVAQRIADINPAANVTAMQARYTPENGESFHLENDDFVIDAIDSLPDKADRYCVVRLKTQHLAWRFFSSMGAARKLDPAKIRTAEFWKVDGCPLARALRTRFRRSGIFPAAQIHLRIQPRNPATPPRRPCRCQRHLRPHHSYLRPHPRQPRNHPALQFARLTQPPQNNTFTKVN